jgi:CHU_C Type IX secretion signal domain
MNSYTFAHLFRSIFLAGLCFGAYFNAQATHIKAGDIKAERTSAASLTYKFTLNLYTRPFSETGIPADDATLNFGDGKSATVGKSQTITFDNTTENNVFIFFHTYSGPGFYKIGYQELNRIASIINMSNSVGTPFYIEMALSISPTSGLNSSPILAVPPIDKGAIGQIYTHNPGAFDPDGDSLAFSFFTPQSDKNVFVGNFKAPDQFGGTSTTGGTPFITIDPISGDIVWNAPSDATSSGSTPRFYNIAIRIDEFRGGVRIGYVIRDMQIEIDEVVNKPPVLKMPSDTCIVAGSLLKDTIRAVANPAFHNVYLESYSGVYSLGATKTFVNNNSPSPISYFNWQTTCDHIREQPYNVVFRAQDISTTDPKLVDVRSFLIYVKAPKPNNLVLTPLATAIKLDWDPYKTTVCTNASKIKIYRKECSSANFVPEPCDAGIPATSGYVLIDEVNATLSTYTDNDKGKGLVPGVVYCYAIVAVFGSPGNGQSYPSNESCGQVAVNVPMLASASVTSTGITNGSILLKWFEPLDLVTPVPPYSYEISRASSDAPTVFVPIDTIAVDTFLVDTGLNTSAKQYFYKTRVLNVADFSPVQSSVVFTAEPRSNAAFLSWNVTMVSNLDTIEIYRSKNGGPYTKVTTLLDKKKIGTYTDATGVQNCDTLNYYALVKGSYCDPRLRGELYSLSPIRQVIPLDDSPPLAPLLTLKSCAPPYNLKVNDLLWNAVADKRCNTIKGYNLYYAPRSGQDLSLLAFLTDTTYIHNMIDSSLAGCYEVKALNYRDVESAASNRICLDNCVYYQLPNLVTRDNNGRNDIFQAFPIPLGVRVVRFNVFNRWGNQIYSYEGDPNINWRTIDGAQNFLSEGVYYYEAEVHYYRRLNPDNETETLKGWVHLIGDKEPPKK